MVRIRTRSVSMLSKGVVINWGSIYIYILILIWETKVLGFISKYHFLSSIVDPLRYLENFFSICSTPSKFKWILSQQRWYLKVIKELLIKSMLCLAPAFWESVPTLRSDISPIFFIFGMLIVYGERNLRKKSFGHFLFLA